MAGPLFQARADADLMAGSGAFPERLKRFETDYDTDTDRELHVQKFLGHFPVFPI